MPVTTLARCKFDNPDVVARLDPMPFFERHMRGDWGDVADYQWQQNNAALESGERLDSFYVVTRDLSIRIFTEADRSATRIVLPSEY